MQISIGGIFWYRNAEDYERVRSISEDGQSFFDSYAKWLKAAEIGFDRMKQKMNTVKVEADIDDYLKWCSGNNQPVASASRIRYTNIKAFEFFRTTRDRQ